MSSSGKSMELLDLFKWAWGLIVPWLFFLHRKVDSLSETAIKREEYNNTIDSIRREIREGNQELRRDLMALFGQLNK